MDRPLQVHWGVFFDLGGDPADPSTPHGELAAIIHRHLSPLLYDVLSTAQLELLDKVLFLFFLLAFLFFFFIVKPPLSCECSLRAPPCQFGSSRVRDLWINMLLFQHQAPLLKVPQVFVCVLPFSPLSPFSFLFAAHADAVCLRTPAPCDAS